MIYTAWLPHIRSRTIDTLPFRPGILSPGRNHSLVVPLLGRQQRSLGEKKSFTSQLFYKRMLINLCTVHCGARERIFLRDRRGLPDRQVQPHRPEYGSAVLPVCARSRHRRLRHGSRRRHARADREKREASLRLGTRTLCRYHARTGEDGMPFPAISLTSLRLKAFPVANEFCRWRSTNKASSAAARA